MHSKDSFPPTMEPYKTGINRKSQVANRNQTSLKGLDSLKSWNSLLHHQWIRGSDRTDMFPSSTRYHCTFPSKSSFSPLQSIELFRFFSSIQREPQRTFLCGFRTCVKIINLNIPFSSVQVEERCLCRVVPRLENFSQLPEKNSIVCGHWGEFSRNYSWNSCN